MTDEAVGTVTVEPTKGHVMDVASPIVAVDLPCGALVDGVLHADMVVQEINRYADSEFRYADKSDEVAIQAMVRDFGRTEEAKRRYLEGKG